MEASSRDAQGQGEDSMKVYYIGMSLAMNALFGSKSGGARLYMWGNA